MDLDRTLTGGLVVDGTGARAYRADVGIRRGRIEAIVQSGEAVCKAPSQWACNTTLHNISYRTL